MKKGIKPKVYIGMSGGVDSSVSAALLKKQGFDVTGVFIKVWQPSWIKCTWKEDRLDAMRVAAKLEIPFVTLDLEKEYKEEVVDYMINEYKKGRTPNPDVMCNRYVKFGGFFDWAMKNGADFVATGHYAQIYSGIKKVVLDSSDSEKKMETDSSGHALSRARDVLVLDAFASPKCPSESVPSFSLVAGNDKNKDQTYFLWTLTQEQLSKTLFPVGNIEKPEVRKLAKKFDLPNAEKKDSQGLCFIGKIDIKEFLLHYIDAKKGDVLNKNGEVIGEHDGAFFFTIGERHGYNIFKKTPNDEPYYVISKDIDKNTITVANKDTEGNLPNNTNKIQLRDVNWNQGYIEYGKRLKARARYREALQDIIVNENNEVIFDKPQSTISGGQSLVIYDGEQCLGGGIII